MHIAYCDVRLVLFYGFLLNGGFVVYGQYSHAIHHADPSGTSVLVGSLATEMVSSFVLVFFIYEIVFI